MATRGGRAGGRAGAGRPVATTPKIAVDQTSTKVADFWWEYVEYPFIQLGLGNPNVRFLVVTLATAGLLWLLKPRAFFHPQTGEARPSIIRAGRVPDAVILDWVLFSIFVGSLTVLFV